MPNIRFLTLAETEVDDAVFWYQKHSEDESLNFLAELNRAFLLISTHPQVAPQIRPGIHSLSLRRFPYSLIYGLDNNLIVVIAVAHQRRKPQYWVDRLTE